MKNYLKTYSTTILTCVSMIGVVCTSIASAKCGIKAHQILSKEAETDKLKRVKKVLPAYLPAIMVGFSTIACMSGIMFLNQRQQASLLGAYSLMDSSYKEYKKASKELYGEESDMDIKKEIAKSTYVECNVYKTGENQLFYDSYSMRYFESTFENVLRAQYSINELFASETFVTLNDFYKLLGIPEIEPGDNLMWRADDSLAFYDLVWIGFENEKVVMFDGLECYVITIKNEPIFNTI